jgi:hypothetical protein
MGRAALFLIQHHLGNARPVAHIQKDQVAMVAPPVHPTHQHNILPRPLRAKLPTHLRPLQTTKKV